jgi:Mlc titration factor MtfA (ptsG expression regulator)
VLPALARSWVSFVVRQLQHPPRGRSHINRYGYTNQAELFAVLAEYFFKLSISSSRSFPDGPPREKRGL